MAKNILIRDLTLRDGQQSLLATRMTQEQVDRTLPLYKYANFYAMEVWGGAVPDSVMRYLKEDPWVRLQKIKEAVGNSSKLTALSRGRNLFGYNPYPEEVIEGFNRHAIQTGVDIMRIFDALNDTNNLSSTIKYVKQNNGIADGAVCYTVDPKLQAVKKFFGLIKKERHFEPLFTVDYFVEKAKIIEKLGADMITIKDMAGLVPPNQTREIIQRLKKELHVPIDFHTHCTPGFGLASVLTAIVNGVDIVDTNIWYFAGGPAAPAFEIIYLFCKKLGIDTGVDIEAVAQINSQLIEIRKELSSFDEYPLPAHFDLTKDTLPASVEKLFDNAIEASMKMNEEDLLKATHAIESHFGFPAPDDKVRDAEIPGGMYTNMVSQLKQLGLEDLLDTVLKTVPQVRIDAGCPPLVTPTSQIVGVQAVNCVIDENKGLPRYTNNNTQFVNLVKGNYGKTPMPIDTLFRKKITGSETEVAYNTDEYKKQNNPVFPEYNNIKLAENEKEELLLELFPNVAEPYLKEKIKTNFENKKNEQIRLEEESYLKAKLEFDAMSQEQKKERLLEGLYKYNWHSFMPSENGNTNEHQETNTVKKES
jgi:pyruvate carboxylase subunit B